MGEPDHSCLVAKGISTGPTVNRKPLRSFLGPMPKGPGYHSGAAGSHNCSASGRLRSVSPFASLRGPNH